jgi:hypothetical protein
MASIEWGANAALCRSLDIKKLPTVHFYKGPLKLAGFAAGPSKIGLVKDTLEHYIDVSDTELDFENEMKQGHMCHFRCENCSILRLTMIVTQ